MAAGTAGANRGGACRGACRGIVAGLDGGVRSVTGGLSRAAEASAVRMRVFEMRMFVSEPQPERVAGVLRPIVSGGRRGEIVVVEERRTLSQKGKVVFGKLAQHRLDFHRVGRVGRWAS